MTEFLERDGERIAYEVTGEGPLVVLSHGMGDRRQAFRFLTPRLAAAGFRVASADLRGQGESSTGWSSYTRTDVAEDLLALIRRLGGPAAIVGHSFSGGAATIAAAKEPGLVSAVVEIGSFTRAQRLNLGGLLRNGRYRKGLRLVMLSTLGGSLGQWVRYLDHAYPGAKPADYAEAIEALRTKMSEPGRMAVLKKMATAKPTDAGAQLANMRCPALIVMGTLDPDWADPLAEAAGIVAGLPAGLGQVRAIEGAGHYPHTQFPDEVAAAVVPFLSEHAMSASDR
ncbi:alpha/beta hydrolase [Amycolatopsis rhizosphaerae]|uniref:Alpha/beta hydrolase n=1 Tax=Amycolatopsis rhizosphaerae TaxID=2053003 RepID=A0A558BTF5_9PSEU|nr:alpha/beta hydrolase [Amycolatopsis rhizosphaerae]TVT39782.1 alpha/beta hydrolase [Amycolatopsis rhizosphaerae]